MDESQRIGELVFVTRLGYIADRGELMDRLHGLCRLELRSVLDAARWNIRRIAAAHHRQLRADAGAACLEARGRVERLDDDAVTFRVTVLAGAEEVVDCSITLGFFACEAGALRIVSSLPEPAFRDPVDAGEAKPRRAWAR